MFWTHSAKISRHCLPEKDMSLELICWGNLPISADLCQETCHTQFHLRGSYLKGRQTYSIFSQVSNYWLKKNQGIELLVSNYHGEV